LDLRVTVMTDDDDRIVRLGYAVFVGGVPLLAYAAYSLAPWLCVSVAMGCGISFTILRTSLFSPWHVAMGMR
jgi:hypothetical protein